MALTSQSSGTGPATVAFSVAANADSAHRSGTLTVAGQTLTVQQDGAAVACTYTIDPQSANATKDGGAGSFALTTATGCAWTAASQASWVTVTSPSSGTGSSTIAYSVGRNDQPQGRSGTISAGGRTFTVTQSGDAGACSYSVTPVEFAPCMVSTTMSSQITAPAGCSWTAAPSASWITVLSGASGTGSATISFKVEDNWTAPRRGTVMVRWPTPTAGQNLQVAQAGCSYAVTRDTFTFAASGGTATFDVFQQSEPYTCGGPLQNACVWSAVSDSSWIAITSSMPRAGDDRVSFTVQANPSSQSRSGTITVRDKVVRITQGG